MLIIIWTKFSRTWIRLQNYNKILILPNIFAYFLHESFDYYKVIIIFCNLSEELSCSFTHSHIFVTWKNTHYIIILIILYIMPEKSAHTLCECVKVWIWNVIFDVVFLKKFTLSYTFWHYALFSLPLAVLASGMLLVYVVWVVD